MNISNLKQKYEAIPTKRLQEMLFEKHLSLIWGCCFMNFSGFQSHIIYLKEVHNHGN